MWVVRWRVGPRAPPQRAPGARVWAQVSMMRVTYGVIPAVRTGLTVT